METNSNYFSMYQEKDLISESEDSDDNIVDNSEDENVIFSKKYDTTFVPRKKKIQVIVSSDEEGEVLVLEHSAPVQALVSACSSSGVEPRDTESKSNTNSNIAHVEKNCDSDIRNRPGQNIQPSVPTNVDKHILTKKITEDVSALTVLSSQNILEPHQVFDYGRIKKTQSSKSRNPCVNEPIEAGTSLQNTSSVPGACNVRSLPEVPRSSSSTHHSSVFSKKGTAAVKSVKKEDATFTSKPAKSLNSETTSEDVIVISNADDTVKNREQELREKISKLIKDRDKMKVILKSSNLAALPDSGARLQMQVELDEKEIRQLKRELENTLLNNVVLPKAWSSSESSRPNAPYPNNSFPQQSSARPLGMKGLETLRVEKYLTNDALEQLHGSLKSRPSEETVTGDPDGFRTGVQLMPHQKRALAWLMWRETQKPRGGILADDMGLGKTLTMISLIIKSKQEKLDVNDSRDSIGAESEKENQYHSNGQKMEKGGTLVVCPASLLNQWEEEVHSKCRRGLLEVEVYHGNQRDKPRRLARKDVVITTYNLVRTEAGVLPLQRGNSNTSQKIATMKGNLFHVKWERVILDEAHVIRNYKSQTSVAVCLLSARHRWALTGTPIHNKELDLYALLKFLRCSPFDDILVWRRWVDNKNAMGQQRLNTVVNSIMLRRTKAQLQEKGALECLPEKNDQLIYVRMDKEEFEVYQKVLIFSKTLFAQFLCQRAEREQMKEGKYGQCDKPTYEQDHSLNDHLKLNKELATWSEKVAGMGHIESFQMLVLILRLRQLCCHPSLISAMLEKDICEAGGIEDDDGTDVDLLTQFSNLGLKNNPKSLGNCDASLRDNVLRLDNPVFQRDRVSSKMRVMLEKIQERIVGSGDKAIVVSQWTSMLDIVGDHLQNHGISCQKLTGAVPVKDRMDIVTNFNKSSRGPSVLLLSLTAGGVGLNLVGANHLFLFDIHWNPQLEAQACDRIYRFGQKKAVHFYKFVCEDTIEQKIKMLQDLKLSIASNVLNGARNMSSNKLSLNDLKMLFGM